MYFYILLTYYLRNSNIFAICVSNKLHDKKDKDIYKVSYSVYPRENQIFL